MYSKQDFSKDFYQSTAVSNEPSQDIQWPSSSRIDGAINCQSALSQTAHNFKTTLKAYNEAFRVEERAEVAA